MISIPRPSLTAFALLATGAFLACGGSGGGGPQDPGPDPDPDPPVVTSVSPAEARAGEDVTIAGERFGSDASAVTVTFGGAGAELVSVASTSIVSTVPDRAAGDAPVVVTVSGRSSSAVAFEVLAAPPSVTSIEPNPAVAGETLTIRGENLAAAAVAGLRAAQGPTVQIDGVPFPVTTMTPDALTIDLPIDLPPGTHELVVNVGGTPSDPFAFDSHLFDPTGTYAARVAVTGNTCGQGAAPGSFFGWGVAILDYDGDGDIDLLANGEIHPLQLDPITGELGAQGPPVGGSAFDLTLTGQSGLAGGVPVIDFDLFLDGPGGCRIEGSVDGAPRSSPEAVPMVHSVFSFGDILPPGAGGLIPPGPRALPTRDALTGESTGQTTFSCVDQCFFQSQPPHVGINNGRFRVEATWDHPRLENPRPLQGYLNPLATDQPLTFHFFDASNVERITRVLEPSEFNSNFWFFYGALSNVQYEITVVDVEGEGSGFTTIEGGGVCHVAEPILDTQAFATCP